MNLGEVYYCSRCMRVLEEEQVCPYCGYHPSEETTSWALEEGTLLQQGRYQLGAQIGAGGFGITYSAWDHLLQMPAAIKEYMPQGLARRAPEGGDEVQPTRGGELLFQKGLDRFRREARILGSLQEVRGVVTVRDCFAENGTAYLVMEFVRGITLDQYVAQRQLSPSQLLELVEEVVGALEEIHRHGVLHRDISPGNLLVQEDGSVKLIDFGAAARLSLQAQGQDRTVILNKRYAPVEQYDAHGRQGPWTDVYGLCATLYALLTGEAPPESIQRQHQDTLKPLSAFRLDLTARQRKALENGLLVDPARRTQSMEELAAGLYGGKLPWSNRLRAILRRSGRTLGVCGAAAVLLAVLVGGLVLLKEPQTGLEAPLDQGNGEPGEVAPGEPEGEPEQEKAPAAFTLVGNTSGNLQNGGSAVDCGGVPYYYYPDGTISYTDEEFGIQHLGRSGYDLNYLDGALYYLNEDLYPCRTTLGGGEEEVLLEEACTSLFVTDTGFYYTQPRDPEDAAAGYRLLWRGWAGEYWLVSEACADAREILLDQGRLYYRAQDGFYRMEADGSGVVRLNQEQGSCYVLADGWIYYDGLNEVRRFPVEGGPSEPFVDLDLGFLCAMNAWEGALYYTLYRGAGEPGELWRAGTDGSPPEQLWTGGGGDGRAQALYLSVVQDTLYFHLYDGFGSSSFEQLPLS